MIGMRPRQVCTAVPITWPYSCGSSEKNSPVPPAAKSAVAPYGINHSSRSAYGLAAKRSPASKSVSGNDSRPDEMMVFSSCGVIMCVQSLGKALQRSVGVAPVQAQHLVPHLARLSWMPGMPDIAGHLPPVFSDTAVPDLRGAAAIDGDAWRCEVLVHGLAPECARCGLAGCAAWKLGREFLLASTLPDGQRDVGSHDRVAVAGSRQVPGVARSDRREQLRVLHGDAVGQRSPLRRAVQEH